MQRFESTRPSQGVRSLRVKSDGAIASAMPFPGMALAVLTTSAYFPPEGYFATCPLGSFGLIGVVSVPGRGYNFVCPVSVQEPAQVPPPPDNRAGGAAQPAARGNSNDRRATFP